jgi:hypothetical protein
MTSNAFDYIIIGGGAAGAVLTAAMLRSWPPRSWRSDHAAANLLSCATRSAL